MYIINNCSNNAGKETLEIFFNTEGINLNIQKAI